MRPSGAGLGNISGQECTFSYMYTCIGYKLPTFGEYMLVGGFLCALRAQGWGICLVRNVHFLICILVLDINCQQVPPGQVPLWTSSPRTSSPGRQASKKDNFPPDKFHFGQVPPGQVPLRTSSPRGVTCLLANFFLRGFELNIGVETDHLSCSRGAWLCCTDPCYPTFACSVKPPLPCFPTFWPPYFARR